MEAVNNKFGSLFLRYEQDKAMWPSAKEASELLAKGADPNMGFQKVAKNKDKRESSSIKSNRFHRALLSRLHENKIERPPSTEIYYEAVQIGRSNPVQWQYSRYYFLPLVVAVSNADIDMVRTLGEHGARLNKMSVDQFGEEHYFENPFRVVFSSHDQRNVSSKEEILGHHSELSVTQMIQAWRRNLLQTLLRYTDFDTERVRGWLTVCLEWALKIYEEELVRMLLSHGTRLEGFQRPFGGITIRDLPLTFLRYLLQESALRGMLHFAEEPMVTTVLAEDEELYHLLMEHPTEAKHYGLDFHDARGRTLLHISVGNRDGCFCQLLSEKLDIDVADDYGNTALHYAAYYGHTDAVKSLLKKGSNPNRKNVRLPAASYPEGFQDLPKFDWTPLHLASYRGFGSIVNELLDGGADSSTLDCEGFTPLDAAMEHDHTGLSFELVERGLPFTAGTTRSSRLLEQAYYLCRYAAVDRLLNGGAEPPQSLSHITKRGISSKPMAAITLFSQKLLHAGPEDRKKPVNPSALCNGCAESIAACIKSINQYDNSPLPLCIDPHICRLGSLLADIADAPALGLSRAQPIWMGLEFALDQRSETLFMHNKDGPRCTHTVRRISPTWDRLLSRIETYPDDSTESNSAFAMATTWLHCCLESHRHCSMHRNQSFTPTRLVDLGDLKTAENFRLVTRRLGDEPYVALSHLWGREGLPRTTLSNLNDHIHGIPAHTLSRTIKDAIRIVQRLGLRYLWIDALCIIQDSQDDWISEASEMGSVYRGALFTLAVADSEQHSDGIFRSRKARCLRPFRINRFKNVPYRDREIFDGEGEFYVFPNTSQIHSGVRPKGPLDTRGWTLQEQLLSPRILYYGNGELFWDCLTVSASESSPISTSLLNDDNSTETWAFKLLRKSIAGSADVQILKKRLADIWKEFIQNYSARKLTLISDKVVAMEGIIKVVAEITNDTPVAGMWHKNLWSQLLWYKKRPSGNHVTENAHMGFPAPSWSWLGSEHPVAYQNTLKDSKARERHDFTDLQPRVSVYDIQVSKAVGNIGLHGKLTLRGPCFQYRLTQDDLHRQPVWKRWNQCKLKINPGRWMLDFDVDTPQDVWCMVMAEDEVAKLMVCLCIVPVDSADSEMDTWKRVGICHWEGLLHQVVAEHGAVETRITMI